MATYQQLLAQPRPLDGSSDAARRQQMSDAIASVQRMIEAFELARSDVYAPAEKEPRSTKGRTVPPKYRDPATGVTWTGRGKTPRWIAGRDRAPFLIT
ncbi:H-NS histone family protein [uncultured Xylophilus sp.]|uniref:H-NS histone family protein n=1 Tax=uncultured Xylophilus sp. TaxID=296832 RepID=UPI0025E96822|nr:H-NS histone family protein [uncultured Xylophilus sp.]